MASRLPDLVGIKEIVEMTGYTRGTVDQHRHRGTLPDPEIVVSTTPIWRKTTIEKWMRSRGLET